MEFSVDRAVEVAFEASTEVWLPAEVNPAKLAQHADEVRRAALLPRGERLAQVVAPGLYQALQRRCAQFEIDCAQFESLKPGFVATPFTRSLMMRRLSVVDTARPLTEVLARRATAANVPLQFLETFETVVRLEGEAGTDALRSFVEAPETLLSIQMAVERGDEAAVERSVESTLGTTPHWLRMYALTRNLHWFDRLQPLLHQPGQRFVCVGAANLMGPQGLVALFSNEGFKVERLQSLGATKPWRVSWKPHRAPGGFVLAFPDEPSFRQRELVEGVLERKVFLQLGRTLFAATELIGDAAPTFDKLETLAHALWEGATFERATLDGLDGLRFTDWDEETQATTFGHYVLRDGVILLVYVVWWTKTPSDAAKAEAARFFEGFRARAPTP